MSINLWKIVKLKLQDVLLFKFGTFKLFLNQQTSFVSVFERIHFEKRFWYSKISLARNNNLIFLCRLSNNILLFFISKAKIISCEDQNPIYNFTFLFLWGSDWGQRLNEKFVKFTIEHEWKFVNFKSLLLQFLAAPATKISSLKFDSGKDNLLCRNDMIWFSKCSCDERYKILSIEIVSFDFCQYHVKSHVRNTVK